MNFYPIRFPAVFQKSFPKLLFHKQTAQKIVYLTFDDGPKPQITEWVLDLLQQYQAKATFFCLGKHIEQHPGIIQRIVAEKHQIGNHTFNHLNGWKTEDKTYLDNTIATEKLIEKYTTSKRLFRPPYGRIKTAQIKLLQKHNFKIVMWTSISGDFTPNLNTVKTIKKLTKKTKSGDILVFHDSTKAEKNMKSILPTLMSNLLQKGFVFQTL